MFKGSNLQLLGNENISFFDGERESVEYREERETRAEELV